MLGLSDSDDYLNPGRRAALRRKRMATIGFFGSELG